MAGNLLIYQQIGRSPQYSKNCLFVLWQDLGKDANAGICTTLYSLSKCIFHAQQYVHFVVVVGFSPFLLHTDTDAFVDM